MHLHACIYMANFSAHQPNVWKCWHSRYNVTHDYQQLHKLLTDLLKLFS